jgi:hypothetical protein
MKMEKQIRNIEEVGKNINDFKQSSYEEKKRKEKKRFWLDESNPD